MLPLIKTSSINNVKKAIETKRYKTVCINDNIITDNIDSLIRNINISLETVFPNKCKFEK